MLFRARYDATSRFMVDDNATLLEFSWSFEIKKN